VGKQSRFRSLKLGSGFSLYEGSKGMFTFLEGKGPYRRHRFKERKDWSERRGGGEMFEVEV